MNCQTIVYWGLSIVTALAIIAKGGLGFSLFLPAWGVLSLFFPSVSMEASTPNIKRLLGKKNEPRFITAKEMLLSRISPGSFRIVLFVVRLTGVLAFYGAFSLYSQCAGSSELLCSGLL